MSPKSTLLASLLALTGSIKAQQPLQSDFFDVVIIEATTKVWDDGGSGAKRNVAIWKATPPSGYFTFGHQLTKEYNPSKKPITIALRPKGEYQNQALLKPASGFKEVWNDAGSGSDKDVRIFEMQCPGGYVALGMVASDGAPRPNDNACGCIKLTARDKSGQDVNLVEAARFLSESKSGNKVAFWDDAGSGADRDVAFWKMVNTGSPGTDFVALPPNTFFASGTHNETPNQRPYSLNLRFDAKIDEPIKMAKTPTLTRAQNLTADELRPLAQTREYKLPFFAVKDPAYEDSQFEQFMACPVYVVERTSTYSSKGGFGAPPNGNSASFTYTLSKGLSREKNWNAGMGIAFGISTTVGVEAGAPGAATVSSSITMSMETSFSYSWGGAVTNTEEESTAYTLNVAPGQWGQLLQEVNEYKVYRTQNGRKTGNPINTFTSGELDYVALFYDPNKVPLITPGTEMVVGKKYTAANGRNYVQFQPDGNVVVNATSGNTVAWDLITKKNLQGTLLNKAKKARMQSDGNFVLLDAGGNWLWGTQTTEPGSSLSINSKGNLIVISPDGDELWNGTR